MPYYLVGIRGDPAQAAGLLAKGGIENVVDVRHTSPETADDAPRMLTAPQRR
jgi:hypothetical protein